MGNYDYSEIFSAISTSTTASLISNLVSLALSILMIVALWKLFEKAGEHGWAALIPYYSSYVLYKISGKKNLFWGYLVVTILMVIDYIVLAVCMVSVLLSSISYAGNYYGNSHAASEGAVVASAVGVIITIIIACIGAIVLFVFKIMQCIGLTKTFDVSGGYAVGLIFLPHIFYCIFAFSSNILYTAGAPKYGYAPYGAPGGYAPQGGGQSPVFVNPYTGQAQQPNYYSQQPNYYGQAQQPVYNQAQQPNYGQPQQPVYNQAPQPNYGQPQQPVYNQAPQQPNCDQSQQPSQDQEQ